MATDAEIEAMKRRQQGKVEIVSPNASPQPQVQPPQVQQPQPQYIQVSPGYPPPGPPGVYYKPVIPRQKKTGEKVADGFKEIRETVNSIKGVKGDIQELNEVFNPSPPEPKIWEQDWFGELVGNGFGKVLDVFEKKSLMGDDLKNYEIKMAINQGLIRPKIHEGYQLTELGMKQQGSAGQPNVNPQTQPAPQQTQEVQQPQKQGIQVQPGFLKTATDDALMVLAEQHGATPELVKKIFKDLKAAQSRLDVTEVKEGEFQTITQETPQQTTPQNPAQQHVNQPPPQQTIIPKEQKPDPPQSNEGLLLAEIRKMNKGFEDQKKEFQDQINLLHERVEELKQDKEEPPQGVPAQDNVNPQAIPKETITAIKNMIADKINRKEKRDKTPINEKNLMKLTKKQLISIENLLLIDNIEGETNKTIVLRILKKVKGK